MANERCLNRGHNCEVLSDHLTIKYPSLKTASPLFIAENAVNGFVARNKDWSRGLFYKNTREKETEWDKMGLPGSDVAAVV